MHSHVKRTLARVKLLLGIEIETGDVLFPDIVPCLPDVLNVYDLHNNNSTDNNGGEYRIKKNFFFMGV